MARLSIKCSDHEMSHHEGAARKEGITLQEWVIRSLDASVDELCDRLHHEQDGPCSCWQLPDGLVVTLDSK